MPSRTAFIVAALCAAIAGVGTFVATERDGDPEDRIDSAMAQVPTIPKLLEASVVRVQPKDAPKSTDTSRSQYVLAKPDGTRLVVDGPKDMAPKELELAAEFMSKEGWSELNLVDPIWVKAEGWWQGLTWSNRRIARSQALTKFPYKPTGVPEYEWGARTNEGAFSAEETLAFNLRRAAYASAALAATFLVIMLVPMLVAWLWRGLLARIREISQAVRGEK